MSILPLDDFFECIAFNHWWGWQLGDPDMPAGTCNNYVRQQAWQNAQAVGRDDIQRSIEWAEKQLTKQLNYSPGPTLTTDQISLGCWWHQYGPACSTPFTVQTSLGKVQRIGSYTWQLIGTANYIPSDEDGDTLQEIFTSTIADSTTDPSDVGVFIPTANLYNNKTVQVRPVTVTRLDANTLQAVGNMWLLVKPPLYYGSKTYPGFDPAISGTDTSGAIEIKTSTNYVPQVAFYKRVWTNENQATLNVNKAGVITPYTLKAVPFYPNEGLISLGGQIPCTCDLFNFYGYGVVSISITYLSGDDLEDWKYVIARLALADLNRFICGCESPEWFRWQQNLANKGGPLADLYSVPEHVLDNPFGSTKAGAVFAWQQVLDRRLLPSVIN